MTGRCKPLRKLGGFGCEENKGPEERRVTEREKGTYSLHLFPYSLGRSQESRKKNNSVEPGERAKWNSK